MRIFTFFMLLLMVVGCNKKPIPEAANDETTNSTAKAATPSSDIKKSTAPIPKKDTAPPIATPDTQQKPIPVKAPKPIPKQEIPVIDTPPPIQNTPPPPAETPPAKPAKPTAPQRPISTTPIKPIEPSVAPEPKTEESKVEEVKPAKTTERTSDVEETLSDEEIQIRCSDLVKEIGTYVKESPSGSGTRNSIPYLRKDLKIDETSYQIILSETALQVREGDPSTDNQFKYFLGSSPDFKLSRVMQMNGKIPASNVSMEISKMEMNFSQSQQALLDQIQQEQGFGLAINRPDYTIQTLDSDQKTSIFLFSQTPTVTISEDRTIQQQNYRQWFSILMSIRKKMTEVTIPTISQSYVPPPKGRSVLRPK